MPTPYLAWNLEDFHRALQGISILSLHYHLIEARLRLGIQTNDFSHWFRTSLQKEKLAKRVEDIDLYLHTLEEIRGIILQNVFEEMES
jgi:hypothetical protein